MLLSLATIVLASNLVVAAAGEVPQFDLGPSCRALERPGTDFGLARTVEACKRDELDARDQLAKQWAKFPAADKKRCTQLSTLGGVPSYVELLTCLEIARDVRILRNQDSTTGQGR